MILPGPITNITALAASVAATTAAQTAMNASRIASGRGGHSPEGKFASDAVLGQWEGVQCCPSCLEPVSEREKRTACCSKCGYTDSTIMLTKTRARRKVSRPDGTVEWEYKSSSIDATSDQVFYTFLGVMLFAFGMIVAGALWP